MPVDPGAPADRDAVDPRAVRAHFARAATSYDGAAVLQREIGSRMIDRLDVVKLAPAAILDAGCGTGDALAKLAVRFPDARCVALDFALPMLRIARDKAALRRSAFARIFSTFTGARGRGEPDLVCGDIAALPFAAASFDLVWSNLALQWMPDLQPALAQLHRVLRVEGLVVFSTFGPDTLKEVRAAFADAGGGDVHVGRFIDMHDIGDMLVHAGFAEPVMHMEQLTLTYADAPALLRDLKAIGATNATQARPRALMGRRRFERALTALEAMRRDGRIPATFEAIYGHAWKVAPTRTGEGHAIVRFAPRRT